MGVSDTAQSFDLFWSFLFHQQGEHGAPTLQARHSSYQRKKKKTKISTEMPQLIGIFISLSHVSVIKK